MTRFFINLILLTVLPISMLLADDLAVTVYNQNLAVVSETRELNFDKGVGELAFRDVPSMIDASSVRFSVAGMNGQDDITILEQNYAFDLVSSNSLYQRFIDKQIELIDKEGRLFTGQLAAFDSKTVTLIDNSGRVKIISLANMVETNFPVLPDGLITQPTLFWLYQSNNKGKRDCEVSYQTAGMGWEAEYVGLLDKNETALDLSGWASINNQSGKSYKDAKLKLIAGDINRANVPIRVDRRYEMSLVASPKGAGFDEKSFFEYHMHTLPRRSTLADKQIKQVSLFEPASTTVKKVYLYEPEVDPKKVTVKIDFLNSSKEGLGMPLPAGRIRMFKADDDGSMVLLGEDRIKHTPQDEKLSVEIGAAFDIVPEQKIINITRISQKVEKRDIEIEFRNRKAEDVTIRVEKRLYGYWEITKSNFKYEKLDANRVLFEVPVSKRSVSKIEFTVRTTSR